MVIVIRHFSQHSGAEFHKYTVFIKWHNECITKVTFWIEFHVCQGNDVFPCAWDPAHWICPNAVCFRFWSRDLTRDWRMHWTRVFAQLSSNPGCCEALPCTKTRYPWWLDKQLKCHLRNTKVVLSRLWKYQPIIMQTDQIWFFILW